MNGGNQWIDDMDLKVKVMGDYIIDEEEKKIPHGIATVTSAKIDVENEKILRSGCQYTGTFVNGKIHGYGMLQYHMNGDFYEGEF